MMFSHFIGGSKGVPGTPPGGPNSSIFMQFSANKLQNNVKSRIGAPPQEYYGSATAVNDDWDTVNVKLHGLFFEMEIL